MQDDNIIIGDDLNLTINKEEIWGDQGREDKLSHFFLNKFETRNLVDVESVSLKPTWYNNQARAKGNHKRLDRFLVKEALLISINCFRS